MPDYDLGTARGTIELDASSLGRAQAAFATLGVAMLGFSAVAVGGFALVVKEAADFERVMSAVKAVSGATDEQMQQLRDTALELGANTVFAATDIGRAMEQLAKAGITTEEILGGAAEATITLAAAAGEELAGGVDAAAVVIANAMRTFSAGADELDHFADVIVGAAASSTISVDDMATSMTYAGPIAASLGLSIDDLSAALAILGDRGIRGSTAGTSLRGVLLSLQGTSGPARQALEELGIITQDGANAFYDMHGNLKPLPEVMQILGDATRNLSEQERVAAFNAIFQRRAMNAAMILADQGAAGFDAYAAAIAGIDAGDVAATKLDNLSGDMTLLKNNVNALVISVGLKFQDMLRGWVQGLDRVVDWLHTLDPALLANVVQIVAMAGVLTGLLGGMSLAISMGLRMYRNFVHLAEGIRIVIGAMRLLTTTLLTNPWFLLIAAIVALGVVLYDAYQNSEEFRAAVDNLWQDIQSIFVPIINTIVQGVQTMVEAFQSGASSGDGFLGFMSDVGAGARVVVEFLQNELIPGIRAFFSALVGGGVTSDGFVGTMERLGVAVRAVFFWIKDVAIPAVIEFGETLWEVGGTIVNGIGAAINWLVEEVFPKIGWVASEVAERVVSAFQWFMDNVMPVFTAFGDLVGAIITEVVNLLGDMNRSIASLAPLWNAIWNNLVTIVTVATAGIRAAVQVFIDFVQRAWELFGDNLLEYATIIWDLIRGIVEGVLSQIQGIIQVITGVITGDWDKAWDGIKNILSGIWQVMFTIVRTAIDGIKLAIQTFVDTVILIWDTAWNTVKTVLQTAWDTIKTAVSRSIDTLLGFFRALPGNIVGAIGDVASLLYNKGNEILGSMSRGIHDVFVDLWNFFYDLPGTIIRAIGNVASLLWNIGRDIIQGLINGIRNKISDLMGIVGDIASSIKDAVGGFFGISSPSKLMHGFGQDIVQGLINGIDSLSRDLAVTAEQVGLNVTGGGAAAMVPAVSGGSTTNLTFDFTNAQFGDGSVEEVKAAITSGDVLTKILQAAKAGKRG